MTEYTLGAQPINPDHTKPDQPARLWVPDNVDYDVSYVNYVYMPAVMEPYGNPLIGYIGSPSTINSFKTAIDDWSASSLGADWPLYKGNDGQVISGKIPSALEIFLNSAAFDNTNVFMPAPVDSKPIMNMTKEWEACVKQNGSDAICPLIRSVTALLNANYENYQRVGTQRPGIHGRTNGDALASRWRRPSGYSWLIFTAGPRSWRTAQTPQPTSFTTRPATTIRKSR